MGEQALKDEDAAMLREFRVARGLPPEEPPYVPKFKPTVWECEMVDKFREADKLGVPEPAHVACLDLAGQVHKLAEAQKKLDEERAKNYPKTRLTPERMNAFFAL